jgi:hypothetical protein
MVNPQAFANSSIGCEFANAVCAIGTNPKSKVYLGTSKPYCCLWNGSGRCRLSASCRENKDAEKLLVPGAGFPTWKREDPPPVPWQFRNKGFWFDIHPYLGVDDMVLLLVFAQAIDSRAFT